MKPYYFLFIISCLLLNCTPKITKLDTPNCKCEVAYKGTLKIFTDIQCIRAPCYRAEFHTDGKIYNLVNITDYNVNEESKEQTIVFCGKPVEGQADQIEIMCIDGMEKRKKN
jgi:hypothetical protein